MPGLCQASGKNFLANLIIKFENHILIFLFNKSTQHSNPQISKIETNYKITQTSETICIAFMVSKNVKRNILQFLRIIGYASGVVFSFFQRGFYVMTASS
jgi:hypothetical protein